MSNDSFYIILLLKAVWVNNAAKTFELICCKTCPGAGLFKRCLGYMSRKQCLLLNLYIEEKLYFGTVINHSRVEDIYAEIYVSSPKRSKIELIGALKKFHIWQ